MFKVDNPYSLTEMEVIETVKETEDTVTLRILSYRNYSPGQYNMIYIFGLGEAPITIAGRSEGIIEHTVRSAGDVTGHIVKLKAGDKVYIRGPYGNSWDLDEAEGKQLVLISGGLGLAAIKWIMEEAIKQKDRFRGILSLYGSKSYDSLLYRYNYEKWSSQIDFKITIDHPDKRWKGDVGLITELIKKSDIDKDAVVFMCGPDPMVKFSVIELCKKGVSTENIFVSMERHMKCSVGTCGHCMFGPYFVCKDGPIFRYSQIKEFFERKEV
ncbi:MAG TPA: Ni/Fe hydrogenase subunit gamma [Persephonella sp.]|uniref:Putative [NiFe] hydrogenasegamma subunit n=1 Tax=Persephonella marina (strain DSM 14350 / EX-H1) TaxID=123214 RepID=C0QP85_PERMH|nr:MULTISPECIES: FAD/NAD(P)-binding protein [Persephonella]ACO04842.1 putative [NiFe] hydrogenasegamma subunit [Persephonella marina EX-H1]HCB69904.1 Ni/Fe hydrogenase subunit gamma [Persephonella sp.]